MNNYIYLDTEGKQLINIWTKFAFTNATANKTCPKCGSTPGFYCETPKEYKAWPPHKERLDLLTVEEWKHSAVDTQAILWKRK